MPSATRPTPVEVTRARATAVVSMAAAFLRRLVLLRDGADGTRLTSVVRHDGVPSGTSKGRVMRHDIEIDAEGIALRGWLYLPDGEERARPAVVMAHGFSAVKEMYLDAYAEVFAAAGLAGVVFDNRGFGASDGQPRLEIDPWQQVRDYRHVITWARTRPEVDPQRIGVWGSSYSGGHVLVLGAIDKRIRCVVAQVPLVSGFRNIQRLVRQDFLAPTRAQLDEDREARYAGKAPAMMPVVAEDPMAPSALPTRDSYQWFTETARTRAPAWRNEVTLRSVEMLMEYEPGAYLERISPTPLLMVVARDDHLTPVDLALEAYGRALEPKRLTLLPGGHFDAYVGDGFTRASSAAADFFVEHLGE
jgi:fermentation-respiration switch protein FrsA (DUF1100 family)